LGSIMNDHTYFLLLIHLLEGLFFHGDGEILEGWISTITLGVCG
jgi:hypothetical protein